MQLLSFPLALSFLTPSFAWAGAGLVAIPIIIHLLNRRRFKTVTWAAMEFLLRAMRKNRRRLRFEQWLLLATRCLVLFLLGLALARPLGCENGALAQFGRHTSLDIFVIDNSYSAGYEVNRPDAKTHLDQARKVVQGILARQSTGGESVILITAGKPAKAIVSTPQHDMNAARLAVSRIEQSYGATDLYGALQLALKAADENSSQPNKNLYILTDGTRSAWQGTESKGLQQLGPELAGAFGNITHVNLSGGQAQWNGAILDVRPVDNLVTVASTAAFRTELSANVKVFGPGHDGALQWKVDDQILPVSASSAVDADGAHKVEVGFETGGTHVITATLTNDDRLAVDNVRYRVVDVASKVNVLIVQDRSGTGTSLEAAFKPLRPAEPGKPPRSLSPFDTEVVSDVELEHKVLGDYSAVVLAGVGDLTAAKASALRHYVEEGGSLMIFMGDAVSRDNYNKSDLLPGRLVELKDVGSSHNAFHFDFDPNSPLHRFLSEFRNQPNTGLDIVSVFKYWQLELDPASRSERVLSFLPDQDGRSRAAGRIDAIRADQARLDGDFQAIQGHQTGGAPSAANEDLAKREAALAKRADESADLIRAAQSAATDDHRRRTLGEALQLGPEAAAGLRSAADAIKAGAPNARAAVASADESLKKVVDKLVESGAKLGPGDPAITSSTVGKGHILFIATSFTSGTGNNEWSTFNVKGNFLPLIQELARNTIRSRDWWMNLTVGDSLRIPPTIRLGKAPTLTDPNGQPVLIEPPTESAIVDGEVVYHTGPILKPGVYSLSLGSDNLPIAVNVPATDEADIVTIKDDAIVAALGGIKMSALSYEIPAVGISNREDNDFSWWTMVAVLVLVGFECFIAMKFGHHRRALAVAEGVGPVCGSRFGSVVETPPAGL